MSNKTIKSFGWSFKPLRKDSHLIQYTCQNDPHDVQLLNHLQEQVRNTEDIKMLLDIMPSIEQLITDIPYTLPLLESIYSKIDENRTNEKISLPVRELYCDKLFCQLIWWTSFCEQDISAASKKHLALFMNYETYITNLMIFIGRNCPDIINRAYEDKNQLAKCLESFGCHGLVNSSSGLIKIVDAVNIELTRHIESLKNFSTQIKELQSEPKMSWDPSFESHQRQMSLRLSQVFERLKLNETIQSVLEDILQNQHLLSLLRICGKRVESDKLLIGLFNAFSRNLPADFSLQQMDPIAAQLIVTFHHAYNKLLAMCQQYSPLTNSTRFSSSENEITSNDRRVASNNCSDLKREITKLRNELRVANCTIAQLRKKPESGEEEILK